MAKNRKKMTRKLKERVTEMGDTPASFDSPESSSISNAFYDPLQEKLTVYFKRGRGKCDCAASGHADKPKQHGADDHAKNCSVYSGGEAIYAYNYDGVPVHLWVEFYQAKSKGAFFSSAIRPMYPGKLAA